MVLSRGDRGGGERGSQERKLEMSTGRLQAEARVNREERKIGCGFVEKTGGRGGCECIHERECGESEHRAGNLYWTQTCPVSSGLGFEMITPHLSVLLLSLPDGFKPSSYAFHCTQPFSLTPSPHPRSFHPRRDDSMSGKRGQEEGFGGS